MGLFDKIREPIFLKEDSSAETQLQQLNDLLKTADSKTAEKIKADIKLIEAGMYGEKNIIYELKNSHIPMIVLHDLYLSRGDLSTQIDFLIITRKKTFVVECKNLFGNIEITRNGDFVRTIGNKKEGIYSPITQNKRHLEMVKELRSDTKKNVIIKVLFDSKWFYDNYIPVVVLANPKTILNDKFAPKEIQKQVVRADQLNAFIRKINDADYTQVSEKRIEELAQWFLDMHQPKAESYMAKYNVSANVVENTPIIEQGEISSPPCPKCDAPMILRRATKGDNAGNTFYGCSRYPKCRGIVNKAP